MKQKREKDFVDRYDWWQINGGIGIVTGFLIVVKETTLGNPFSGAFSGGILILLGFWVLSKSKKAFYFLWFLTILGFGLLVGGYESDSYVVNSFVDTILNLIGVGSLVCLSIQLSRENSKSLKSK